MAMMGISIAAEMLDAMGIDSNRVTGFTLDVQVNRVVTVTVTRLLEEKELTGLMGCIRRARGVITQTDITKTEVHQL